MESQMNTKQIMLAMVPTPGMGHLIPQIELAKRLVHQHNLLVTILIIPSGSDSNSPQTQVLESLPTSISTVFLPPVSFEAFPDDVKIETRISLTLTRSLSSLRDAINELTQSSSTRLVSLVVDLFGSALVSLADEFDLPFYVFFPSTAMSLSFLLHLPELDQKFSCEFRDLPEPVQLPGCVPINGSDLTDPVQDKKNEAYKVTLNMGKQLSLAAGIMVNSFMDLEPGAFKGLMENSKSSYFNSPPVYPVGPLIRTGSSSSTNMCLRWLDEQPSESVLFVCFGSGGTLSHEQINELAFGLEMSGQRFLWVIKSPNANYFSVHNMKDGDLSFDDLLPKGFLDRTKGVGLVVPNWAPQAQVLSHGSIGGFMSHCGWNSILESIVLHGVPIIAWPLYAEQRMNAVLLTDDLKVAFRVQFNENGIVGREDIANYAKGLIQGEEGKLLRNNIRVLKDAAANALSPNGSSTKSLSHVVQKWKNLDK